MRPGRGARGRTAVLATCGVALAEVDAVEENRKAAAEAHADISAAVSER